MLITLKEILTLAETGGYAIGAYNTPNLASLMAVLESAEKLNVPVMFQHAQLHEEIMPIKVIGPIMVMMAERAAVPVCVQLDHGEDLDYIKIALELGFTAVMYDGSKLPYNENVESTQKAVELARSYSASVEAELGMMTGHKAGAGEPSEPSACASQLNHSNKNAKHSYNTSLATLCASADVGCTPGTAMYTDPIEAGQFVRSTNIDALACSFGTAHGFYTETPKLEFERISAISKETGIPLVMHGGSGVSPDDYGKCIRRGVRKINYYSYMSRAGVEGIRTFLADEDVQHTHDIFTRVARSMAENVEWSMRIFYTNALTTERRI